MRAEAPAIALDGVAKRYGRIEAVRDISFALPQGGRVALVPSQACGDDALRRELDEAGVELTAVPSGVSFDGTRCVFAFDAGPRAFDVVYPMLGLVSRSSLAVGAGADCDEEGALVVDQHQMTSVDGLYAIGDVVSALNQISVATGHAAIAATDVHNRLAPNPA